MPRPHRFRPEALNHLEPRVVLSQVYFSPQTGVLAAGKPARAEAARPAVTTVQTVSRVRTADGRVETVDASSTPAGEGETSTTEVTREPGGGKETVVETSTLVDQTTTLSKQITLPDGATQAEAGTDAVVTAPGAIQPDGTVQPGSGSGGLLRTTTFDHVLTQPGLGAETIVGTTVQGKIGDRTITRTDQRVTRFDGSTAEVHILTTKVGATSTTETTTTPAGGVATTTTSTTKLLSTRDT